MSKSKQADLEQAIQEARKLPPEDTSGQELTCPFDGVIFVATSRNHYEFNDGKPVAPPLDLNRPTIRQRIENLLNRDPGMLQRYMQAGPEDGSEGVDMDVPDDPNEPLTPSEQNAIDMMAAEIAEAAPLPDEGLPRPSPIPPRPAPETASGAPGGGPEAVGGTAGGSVTPPATHAPSPPASAPPARTPTR